MPLDLTHIPELLALPCVINTEINLTDTLIFTTAERLDETVYLISIKKDESLTEYLRRVYNNASSYEMDCSVYAQLGSMVLSGNWPINGGKMLIFIGVGVGDIMLWDSKIPEMGYITVPDRQVSNDLSKMTTPSKGQWCIQISQDEYLGLATDGPHVFSLSTWSQRLRSGLITYSESSNLPSSMVFVDNTTILRGILDCYLAMGKIDKWAFFPQKDKYSACAQLNDIGAIVTKNTGLPISGSFNVIKTFDFPVKTSNYTPISKVDNVISIPLSESFLITLTAPVNIRLVGKCEHPNYSSRTNRNIVNFLPKHIKLRNEPMHRRRSNAPRHFNRTRGFINKNSGR